MTSFNADPHSGQSRMIRQFPDLCLPAQSADKRFKQWSFDPKLTNLKKAADGNKPE